MEVKEIERIALDIARRYPEQLRYIIDDDIARTAFHVELLLSHKGKDIAVCDIGGGIALFSLVCAAIGMKVTLVDDFSDETNRIVGNDVLDIHREFGIEIVSADVISEKLAFAPESFDAITTFDSLEHWHNSPKQLFYDARRWLKPQGLFVIGVPNCVNLRKRITIPFGIGKWSPMENWYEAKQFRGHVREPDVDDLLYIARDMKLENVEVIGRNWLGYISRFGFVRAATPYIDVLLQKFPQLCANIYMLGVKSSSAETEERDVWKRSSQRSLREAVPRY